MDIRGNRNLELVRKQLREDGRKMELLGNRQTDKGKWNRKRWEPLMTGKAGGCQDVSSGMVRERSPQYGTGKLEAV
jgi:hypothetical protein